MKVLIVPQFSMRSYKTGVYSLLSDGNLNIVLHHIYNSSSIEEYTIILPVNHNKDEYNILVSNIVPMFKCTIKFKFVEYGINADENRTYVPISMGGFDYSGYSKVISYIENLRPTVPWILKMHMSKIDELDRPYADKHYSNFLSALIDKLLIQADVLNYSQYYQVLKDRPNLASKISVNEQCLNTDFYDKLKSVFIDYSLMNKLNAFVTKGSYFFPFRVSDKAYNFSKALDLSIKMDRNIYITDPNNSAKEGINIVTYFGDYDIKTILITMLELIKTKRGDISIPIYENNELAVHQLILEICYMVPNNVISLDTSNIVKRYTFR